MKYATLGIIGHVDHGKTTLVKALTGVDTDRLEEEKRRGISIVLGYSHLTLPSGEFGIIDAPGHEKFIRTMIAGATGSDAVLLAVDVNEGVKPQTIEHLHIAEMLGIRRGVVAITKCDSVDDDMRALAIADVEDLLDGRFLDSAPIVCVSAHTGDGLDTLRAELNAVLDEVEPLLDEGTFYLPIDRVFTMAGHGTVVTGTLRRGALSVDDTVHVMPDGFDAAVRELQTHSEHVDRVMPGRRTAVNLRGVEKAELRAGDVLTTPRSLETTRFLDVSLHLIPEAERALGHNVIVRVLFGTRETYARMHFLDREALEAGDNCLCQLKLEDDVAIPNYEPFVIRSYSPMNTIGGGVVLASSLGRHKRNDAAILERLAILRARDPEDMFRYLLDAAGEAGLDMESFCLERRISKSHAKKLRQQSGVAATESGLLVWEIVVEGLSDRIERALTEFHAKNPTLRGLPQTELAAAFDNAPNQEVLELALKSMRARNRIGIEKGHLFLASFNPEGAMSAADRAVAEEIESAFRDAGLLAPMVADVVGDDKKRDTLYRFLVEKRVLVPLTAPSRNKTAKNNMAFHQDAINDATERLRKAYGESPFTTASAKELLGISRKYLIPLLEHLDVIGVTRRAGEERTLKE